MAWHCLFTILFRKINNWDGNILCYYTNGIKIHNDIVMQVLPKDFYKYVAGAMASIAWNIRRRPDRSPITSAISDAQRILGPTAKIHLCDRRPDLGSGWWRLVGDHSQPMIAGANHRDDSNIRYCCWRLLSVSEYRVRIVMLIEFADYQSNI